MIEKVSSGQRIGEIIIPASKSDAQRAILVAALVPNKSLIYNYGKSDDVKAMLSCIGVLVFVGLTAYDTQKIKSMYYSTSAEMATKTAIMGALTLYLDFINLFLMLLRLFGQRR